MSGTIFSVYSISAFSALPAALKQCRKGYRKKRRRNNYGKVKTLNLVSKTGASSSTAQSSSASNVSEILKAPSQSLSLKACAGRPAAEDSNQNDASSSSQLWQSDAKTNASAERPAATETNQNLDFLASAGKPLAEGSGIVDVDSVRPNNFPDICCPCPTS